MLCGFSVGEYIRNWRLSLAAQELSTTEHKVIDVALKYGYESPDAFAKAFQRFHGILPSQAKEKGAIIKAYPPLKIVLTLEGGSLLEYKIVEKEAFTVVGFSRRFYVETSKTEIPKWWKEYMRAGEERAICGEFGICMDLKEEKEFEYLIADTYNRDEQVPEGCVTRQIPAGNWAVFPCKLSTLQNTTKRISTEWLPNCKEYRMSGDYYIEKYTPDDYCELWLPLKMS